MSDTVIIVIVVGLLVGLFIYYKCNVLDIVIVLLVLIIALIVLYVFFFVDFIAYEYFRKYGLHDEFEKLNGYSLTPSDLMNISNVKTRTLTYGEIRGRGMEAIRKVAIKNNINTFVDMGSGAGKAVFLARVIGFDKCIGVEIVKSRFDMSMDFYRKLPKGLKQGVELYNGDMYKLIDFRRFNEPIIVYASNLLWSLDMTLRLFEKFARESSVGSLIFASKNHDINMPAGLEFVTRINITMSWDSNSMMYIYKKKY